jgi:hypothetical protein
MIIELSLIAGVNYITYKYIARDFLKFKKEFNEIIERIPELKNNQDEKINLISYKNEDYGYTIKFMLPVGTSSEVLEKHLLTIKQALKLSSTHLKVNSRLITLHAIKQYSFKPFLPLKLPPNKLLIAEFMNDYVIVDMNKFPHALICGDTGTGKSRILFVLLTNLIYSSNRVSIYLLQIRKNDLVIFKNCKQVKACSRTLEEVLQSLQEIDEECQRREQLLDIEKGYLNIEDYNKKSGKTLKYIYVVVEEFSFLNVSKGDSSGEKRLKYECMQYLKNIVNAGRSSGVFLITSLQKPTSDSIPTDVKAMLTTRIALNIKDASTCRVVMNNDSAVDLGERELVCRTKDTVKGYSITIDFPDIQEHTAKWKVEKKIEKPKINKNDAQDIMKA